MPFVISKCACDNIFVDYIKNEIGGEIRITEGERILIRGGQGVIEKRSLITPMNGVVTEITEEQAELLKNNVGFMDMVRAGYMQITSSENSAKKEAKNLEKEDDSAQLTADDFAEEAFRAESVGGDLKVNNEKVSSTAKPSRKRKK